MTITVKNAAGTEKHLATSGDGTEGNPYIPEHEEINSAALLAAVQAIETAVEGTLTVAGAVTTGGLTDVQLRATPVPVFGVFSSDGLTDNQLRASAVPVSVASLPLPTGVATSAKQDTQTAHLATLAGDGVTLLYASADEWADGDLIQGFFEQRIVISAIVAQLDTGESIADTKVGIGAAALPIRFNVTGTTGFSTVCPPGREWRLGTEQSLTLSGTSGVAAIFCAYYLEPVAGLTDPSDWWSVPGKTCVGAWQTIGARSFVASRANWADEPPAVAAATGTIDWTAETGYEIYESSHLLTDLAPANTQSGTVLVRVDSMDGLLSAAIGAVAADASGDAFGIRYGNDGVDDGTYFGNGGELFIAAVAGTGVIALAGNTAYVDGVAQAGTIPAPSGSGLFHPLTIGAQNLGESVDLANGCRILAAAVYSDTLTAGEIATVSAAMAAL